MSELEQVLDQEIDAQELEEEEVKLLFVYLSHIRLNE
jgi:hypothetical protein